MPITAFSSEGTILYQIGLSNTSRIDIDHKIYELAYTQLSSQKKNLDKRPNCKNFNWVTITIPNKGNFIACSICPKNITKGIFLLGPYTTEVLLAKEAAYKPTHCIPYFASLIRVIQESNNMIKKQHDLQPLEDISPQQMYSYHVQKAVNYILTNYSKDLSLEAMALRLKINKCYLATLLKQETGMTFTQLVNQVRINKSIKLLKQSEESILGVALAVGYSNQNYYSTTFKRLTGMTPLEFRRQGLNHLVKKSS